MSCNVFRTSGLSGFDTPDVSDRYAMLDTAFEHSDAMSDFVDKVASQYRTSYDTDYRAHRSDPVYNPNPNSNPNSNPNPIQGGMYDSVLTPHDTMIFNNRADSFIREHYVEAQTPVPMDSAPTVPPVYQETTADAPTTTTQTTGTNTSTSDSGSVTASSSQTWWKVTLAVIILVAILFGIWWFFGKPKTDTTGATGSVSRSTSASSGVSSTSNPSTPATMPYPSKSSSIVGSNSGSVRLPSMYGARGSSRGYVPRQAPVQMLFDGSMWE